MDKNALKGSSGKMYALVYGTFGQFETNVGRETVKLPDLRNENADIGFSD